MATMQDQRVRKLVRALMMVLVALSLGGLTAASCGGDKNKDEDAKAEAPADKGGEGGEQGGAKKPDAPAADVPENPYPGFNFSVLEDKERQQFISIAKAELCPCPDSAVSLHDCLSKEETQCTVAKYSALIIANGIKEKKSQTDILDEVAKYVEAIKATYEFELEGVPHMGNPEAKVILIEFADFQCPHCRLASGVMKKVADKYGDKVAFYYKHFPLDGHPQAKTAAVASIAAHRQGKFWPMHDLIFENQMALSPAKLKRFAQQLGLNMKKFEADMENPDVLKHVTRDRAEGEEAKIDGTPSLFINGKRYMGEKSVEKISEYVDELLAGGGEKKDEGAEEKK